MNTTREKVLAALEQACREGFDSPYSSIRGYAKNDDNAVRYGAWAPRVAHLAGLTSSSVRRVLNVEAKAGRVLRHEPYPTAVRWWPAGLLAKLQAEAHQRDLQAAAVQPPLYAKDPTNVQF